MIVVFTPKSISPDCPFKSKQRQVKISIRTPHRSSRRCATHCGNFFDTWSPWLRGKLHTTKIVSAVCTEVISSVSNILRRQLCDRISRWKRNWIRKYFSLFIRGPNRFESRKKMEVWKVCILGIFKIWFVLAHISYSSESMQSEKHSGIVFSSPNEANAPLTRFTVYVQKSTLIATYTLYCMYTVLYTVQCTYDLPLSQSGTGERGSFLHPVHSCSILSGLSKSGHRNSLGYYFLDWLVGGWGVGGLKV